MDAEDPASSATPCWACDVLVQIPVVEGRLAELYKCGWCGAINEPKRPQQRPAGRAALRLALDAALLVLRWLVVVFVLLLICGVVAAGVGVVLPRFCGDSRALLTAHLVLAAFLTFNVLFNYAAAAFRSAGTVRECIELPRRQNGYFAQHSFNGYTFCRPCQAPKPPGVHHCSICKACMVEMDHHCVFLQNCIARSNARHFFLFLVYLIISTLYIMLICGLLIHRHWPLLQQSMAASGQREQQELLLMAQAGQLHHPASLLANASSSSSSSSLGGSTALSSGSLSGGTLPSPQQQRQPPSSAAAAVAAAAAAAAVAGSPGGAAAGLQPQGPPLSWWARLALGLFALVAHSPWWIIVAYYLFVVSLSVCIAIGVLLGSQLKYLALGITYIDFLKAGHLGPYGAEPSWEKLWERLHQVFGGRPSLLWLLPRWSPVPGTLLDSSNREKVL